MRPNHIMLAILAVAIWGCNFIFITLALHDIPPYLLGAIRFFLTAIPAVFFFPKPSIPFQHIFMYGLFTFALQFSFLFAGMYAGMPPGLTSLVFQCQVFFSILLAAFCLKEMPSFIQIIGALVSFSGLALIGIRYTEQASWIGFMFVIGAAFAMAVGNLYSRKLTHAHPLSLIAWGSLMALPMLILTSLYLEGPDLIISSLQHVTWVTLASLAFIAYGSTWLAYGIWNNLLHTYPVALVIPFALLVPFFGMISGHVFFDEAMQNWKIHATWLIIGGLCINILGSRLLARYYQKRTTTESLSLKTPELSSSD